MAPALLYLVIFFALPAALIVYYSLGTAGAAGEIGGPFTFESYGRALDPIYLRVLGRSIQLALLTTVLSVVIGYPTALAIRSLPPVARLIVLAIVTLPAWTNLLIKNYAWIVLLRREGVINSVLAGMGLIGEPLPLLFNDGAVLIGLLHSHLPFMILPLYAALDRLDWRLVEAARDLGAGVWGAFRHVLLPQTLTGLAAGCVMVFVPALGAFVTPALLGGTSGMMVGALIESQILQVRDWPFASALAVWLMVLVLMALGVQQWVVHRATAEGTR